MKKCIETKYGKLRTQEVLTHYLDWHSSFNDREEGFTGLGNVVKKVYGRELEMLVDNCSVFHVKADTITGKFADESYVADLVTKGELEEHDVQHIVVDLYKKGVLPEGSYVITYSY